MAHNMHYVMEKWLVQSLDVFTCDLNLCWLVLETYISTDPRPRLNQVRDTVVPMFLAIMEDNDDIDADSDDINTSYASHWHKFQNDALCKIAEEEMNGKSKRNLSHYGLLDHFKVGLRSALENLVVFPFWAVKVAAICGGGRLDCLRPYPFALGWLGYFKAIQREEGYRGLIKGALPMVIVGVSQALVIARSRHVTFMRLVDRSVEKAKKKKAIIRSTSNATLTRNLLRSSDYGQYGTATSSNTASQSSKKRKAPMQYLTELVRAVIRHPFELLGVRMIISSAPEYSSLFSALWFHFSNNDLLSLFVGIRQSLFNGLFIPLQSQQFLLIGLPTLLRIRRMLPPPGSQSFNGGLGGFEPHAGLGGSVKLLTDMLKQDGLIGLLSCARVTFDIALPAAVSLLIARGIGSLIIGPTREQAIKTEIRLSYLKEMFKPRKKGNLRRRLSSSQLFRDSSSSNFLLSSSSSTDLSSALSSSPSKSPTSNVSTSVSPSSLTESSSSSSSSEGGTKALSVSGFDSNYSVSHPSSSKSSSFTSTPLETIPPSPDAASAQLFDYPTSLPSNPPDVSKLTSAPSEDGFFIDE